MRSWFLGVLLLAPWLRADSRDSLIYKQPLRFEQNRGQASSEFQYVARGARYTMGLTATGNELRAGNLRVRTKLAGARSNNTLEPLGRMSVSTNYFVGSQDAWRTGVSNFERVRYRSVYPGIDLVFYGRQDTVEYDFVVQPGGDPARIQFDIAGADVVRIDPNGDLVIVTQAGEIRWKHPEIYQSSGGETRGIEGGFVRRGDRVGFQIGPYDRARPLVIDPTLSFSTYLGGSGGDAVRGVAVDGSGNIYVSGSATSRNLATSGAAQSTFRGAGGGLVPIGDAFVAKFSPTGTLLFFTYLGGASEDAAGALAVDSAGNAYITGFTNSRDFPVTPGAAQTKFGGGGGNAAFTMGDAFLAKISPAGDKLLYATYLGGFQDDYGSAIAIDATGNAYITGGTQSMDFPVTGGVVQSKIGGVGGQPGFPRLDFLPVFTSGDGFVAKLNPDGSKFLFVTYLGGSRDDTPFAIALDSSSNIYVAGSTISSDFPTTPGALQTKYGGADILLNVFFNIGDGFITKLNPTGTSLIYSTYLGWAGDDGISSLALDAAGNAYVAGVTSSTKLPVTASAFQRTYQGPFTLPFVYDQLIGDGFVAKVDPTGSKMLLLTYLGGESDDSAMSIALDPAGNIAVAGITQSLQFPVSSDAFQHSMGGAIDFADDPPQVQSVAPQGGGGDAFFSVFEPGGTRLLYSTYLGGKGHEAATSLAVDKTGNFYIAGITQSSNFPTLKAQQGAYGGGESDGILARFTAVATSGGTQPVISLVANAFGDTPLIGPNTWVEIKGSNLTAGNSRIWQDSDFVNNRLPTQLDGVSVKMNGTNAYVYFISATQINVLTPPDVATGPVQVQVTTGGTTTAAFTVQAQQDALSFFAFVSSSGVPYIYGRHASDNTLIGPTSLYPGLTTPVKPGETIVLAGNGFGPTSTPVVSGSVTQSGTLATLPTIKIGGVPATVQFAGLVSPGNYQFNVVVPSTGIPDGDNPIVATYNGLTTQPGLLITVAH